MKSSHGAFVVAGLLIISSGCGTNDPWDPVDEIAQSSIKPGWLNISIDSRSLVSDAHSTPADIAPLGPERFVAYWLASDECVYSRFVSIPNGYFGPIVKKVCRNDNPNNFKEGWIRSNAGQAVALGTSYPSPCAPSGGFKNVSVFESSPGQIILSDDVSCSSQNHSSQTHLVGTGYKPAISFQGSSSKTGLVVYGRANLLVARRVAFQAATTGQPIAPQGAELTIYQAAPGAWIDSPDISFNGIDGVYHIGFSIIGTSFGDCKDYTITTNANGGVLQPAMEVGVCDWERGAHWTSSAFDSVSSRNPQKRWVRWFQKTGAGKGAYGMSSLGLPVPGDERRVGSGWTEPVAAILHSASPYSYMLLHYETFSPPYGVSVEVRTSGGSWKKEIDLTNSTKLAPAAIKDLGLYTAIILHGDGNNGGLDRPYLTVITTPGVPIAQPPPPSAAALATQP